eukprot:TRINITY_DN37779_c0_g1_i1.p1 TRINITY_DN37779_c0_g1~~TRINITY_DN37779_c0_g1_i1.p1  ORF type:complete len:1042 (-),score=352.82 TRINITY_DN37779_c0_g1_i1:171-3296(-)
MSTRKPPANPLLASGGQFSLADSFGVTATLPVVASAEEDSFLGGPATPSVQPGLTSTPSFAYGPPPITPNHALGPPPASAGMFASPMSFFTTPAALTPDPFTNLTQESPNLSTYSPQSVSLRCATSPASPPPPLSTPMPTISTLTPHLPPAAISIQGPTPPAPTQAQPPMFAPPPVAAVTPIPASAKKRPTYAPLPYLNSTPAPPASSPAPVYNMPGMPPLPEPKVFQPMYQNQPTGIPPSTSAPSLASTQWSPPVTPSLPPVTAHWFFQLSSQPETWKPFSVEDSTAIEAAYEKGSTSQAIPVDGTRYDVMIDKREKVPVYWPGQSLPIRRCSWFHRSSAEGRWIPYEEEIAEKLEQEYRAASKEGRWQCKVVFDSGEWVMLHSPEVMMHFPTSSASLGALDDWGQVQPQADPSQRPQVVHRGLEGLPDIADGETEEVDHIVFVVHGIGAACDIKFRPIAEVVDGFRDLTADISSKHFAGAHLASKASRVEFLPVNWHDKLHGEDTGTDSRIQPLTLRSIPKLRSFVNDTLLDVLFYTSPLYCQTILDTVCGEINRMFKLFSSRNPGFGGGSSVVGHSLGSLILFDLLAGQVEAVNEVQAEGEDEETLVKPRWDKDLGIEDVFSKLEIGDHLAVFTDQGIGMEELETCSEDDLKEAGLPLGPRKKLLVYLASRAGAGGKSGFAEFQASTVARQVQYSVGPAGTGQPSVRYPRLEIRPTAFFALGSPTGMFMAVRGIESLGTDFQLPTCKNFYNIFHPYDPVAYRIESLVDKEFSSLRPVLVPHHKGRKRMHLELKETMSRVGTDIKQKVMESLKATMGAVYSVAGTFTGQVEQTVETEMAEQVRTESPVQDEVLVLPARINDGRRVDYVLQEAPLESFNEYLFALASHLCYWESEDISLMVLKEIYSTMDITADSELLDRRVDPLPPSMPPTHYPTQTMYRSTSNPVNLSSSQGTFPPQPTPSNLSSPPPAGPPPAMFNINSVPSVSAPKPGLSYPRPTTTLPPHPTLGQGPPPYMGMDPTQPILTARPIAPPPTMGFSR